MIIGFGAVALAGVVHAAFFLMEDAGGPARFAGRHATVNARILEGLGWLVVHLGPSGTVWWQRVLRVVVALAISAGTAAIPYEALRQAGAGPVSRHALSAGVAALILATALEMPAMPERLRRLRDLPPPPARQTIFWVVVFFAIDVAAVALGFVQPGSDACASACIGLAFVAGADLVSLAFGLGLAVTDDYLLA
jgi:hypothetical protein